ncbi:Hypothetical Protein LMG19145_03699 [Xanthomonas arboricola pv. fragariae]|nr:Hypothetical Protein LMG19145_03699 [Xanthomonas arboricola pv. fragariae]
MEAPWRHPCRQGSRNRQGHRARELIGCFLEKRVARLAAAAVTFCSLRVESPFAARLATRKWSEVDRPLSDPTSTRPASLPLWHRPSRRVLARPSSRDLTRHGCRVRAYKDVLAACPAMVDGQGPCSQLTASRARRGHRTGFRLLCRNHAHRPSRLVLVRPPSRDLTRHGCRVRAYKDVLAACPAMVGGQGPCSKLTASRTRRGHRTGCRLFC